MTGSKIGKAKKERKNKQKKLYIKKKLSTRFQLENWITPARLGSETIQLGSAQLGIFQLELITSIYHQLLF